MTVIGIYAPTNDESEGVKDDYEETLNDVFEQANSTGEVILIGNLNARFGRRNKHHIVGSHGEDVVYNNGEHLINVCEQHELKIMNGYFEHKNKHKFTWHQDMRKLQTIIDYLVIKQRSCFKVLDVKVHRGPDCGSDHYLVRAKIACPFISTGSKEWTSKTNFLGDKRYSLERLNEESVQNVYRCRLRQQLREISAEGMSIEDLHTNINNAIHQAALEALGELRMERRRHNRWWNDELEQLKHDKQKKCTKDGSRANNQKV
ncbi:uncharacterized protein LOC124369479 [Homalodisca vitripennis]|uniref:uncharacterized protein LOC124369479 n=1 Tax=Homalodisca vitripennis TaxID=197043 RepID=UPI001EEAF7FC|nr:uncharacterized protein LOC124369479 [Homalodisca vitripennis]